MLMIAKLVMSVIMAAMLSCCGSHETSTTSPTASPTLGGYNFTAKMDMTNGPIPFPAAVGDTITGSFTFAPDTQFSAGYLQKAPATVQVGIGPTVLNADLSNWLGYYIIVKDGTSDPTDSFSWSVNDTIMASSFGLDYIQVVFSLEDPSGAVFSSPTIPLELELNSFTSKLVFISGTKIIDNVPTTKWFLRARVTSLEAM